MGVASPKKEGAASASSRLEDTDRGDKKARIEELTVVDEPEYEADFDENAYHQEEYDEYQGADPDVVRAIIEGKEKEMDPATTKVGPTLVVCPTVAIIQWRGEIGIDSMSDESSPRVGVLDRQTCDLSHPDGVLSHCDRRFRHWRV